MITRQDYRDALGWLYAHARGDWGARNELARVCEPTAMLDALVDMHLGLANIATNGEPLLYLDTMRDQLDDMLDRYNLPEGDEQ